MGLVRGEDVILSTTQYNGSTLVPVIFGCARSVTFDISTDFIETSVTESGAFKTFIPSGKQYSGNIEGLAFINRPASAEIRATTVIGYSSEWLTYFPNLISTGIISVIDPELGPIELCNISDSFLTYDDFKAAIISNFNTNTYGYTIETFSYALKVTARPGLGDSINGIYLSVDYNFAGYVPSLAPIFAGGINPYYPDKLGIGWMYDKIMNGEQIYLKYYETDDDNNYLQKQCSVYIESINETASFDNIVTFSASFKGTGAPIIDYGEI